MYDTVLVPTDGSDHAVRAGEHARYLAELFDATIHVVHVVDVEAAGGLLDAGGVDEEFIARLEAAGEDAIDAVEAVLGDTDSIRTAMRRGPPADEILAYADEHDVELLVMGTHGRTGVDRYVTGSVTERVLRRAEVPLLAVRATERSNVRPDFEEVLVPTDGSDAATAAVDHALAIAGATGARVHAVHVVDAAAVAVSPDYTPPTDLLDELQSQGNAATETIADRARTAGLEAITEVREGSPSRDLLAYADEHDVDLIAMGTAGRTGLGRYLVGSTTERIVRHAEMPVLAVNAREQADD